MRRTLAINQTKFWAIDPASKTEAVDSAGFKTGEFVTTFGTPYEIYLSVYPNIGAIVAQIFGKDYSPDNLAVSNSVDLQKDTLLFLSQPVANYATTYDYRIDKRMASLNTFQYGLKART